MRKSKTNDSNVRSSLCTRPNNREGVDDMTNHDQKQATTEARPTREDMLAFVANGRQKPDVAYAICLGGWHPRKEVPLT